MAKEIENEDGTKETFFSQAELDARAKEIQDAADLKIKENEDHTKKKLDEFQTGKTAQELKDIERDKQIDEAKKKSDEAIALANTTVEGARTKVKDFFAVQFVGEDKELRTKLDDSLKIIEAGRAANGQDIKSDDSIKEMMTQAANMAGIGAGVAPTFPMYGGGAPSFQKKENEISDAEHQAFKAATGYVDPKPPTKA